MSYISVKTFNIDLKNLTIKGTVSPSNVRDHNDRSIIDPFTLSFDTLEELENTLLAVAREYLEGSKKFAPSSTFARRVGWLVDNGYVTAKQKGHNRTFTSLSLKDTPEVRNVLTGKKRIKNKYFIGYVPASHSVSGYNHILKLTGNKVKLTTIGDYGEELTPQEILELSKGTRRLSKLREDQVGFLQKTCKSWLESNKVRLVKI